MRLQKLTEFVSCVSQEDHTEQLRPQGWKTAAWRELGRTHSQLIQRVPASWQTARAQRLLFAEDTRPLSRSAEPCIASVHTVCSDT